jgi:branched-chain amino acid transport system ATP-binding protein
MLEVRGLSAGYAGFGVLEDIHLHVAPGAFVGILGRNGVGKTTLLKAIAGAVRPTRGEVLLRGSLHADPAACSRAGVALVLDRKGIFRSLSVLDNLRLAQRLHRRRSQRWTLEGVLDLFPRLAERQRAPGGGLSGGEQQMLAIARALLCQPDLLLLDEPTEGLAPKIVDEVVGLLLRLRAGGALSAVVVDQRLDTVFDTCGTVHVMSRGRFAAQGEAATLRHDGALLAEHLGV